VLTDLREAEGKENELVEQQRMAHEQLSEIDLRAPQSGTVHDLSAHTVGGVVGPAEVMMLIVPDGDELLVEAQLQPKDIAQVAVGQTAMVRFAAFDRNATPELHGTVSYVSPDTTRDPRTNSPSYTTRVVLTPEEAKRLGDFHLMSGMPAELYLVTQSRTALSYLMKPFLDQLHRMFRGR
jgi:HlyD family secretion protein